MFGALLEEGFEETKPDWPDWMHGYLKGRRREDCELVQRATGARLRAAGVAHINISGRHEQRVRVHCV